MTVQLTISTSEAAVMYDRAMHIAERLKLIQAVPDAAVQSSGELALLCEHYGCDKGAVIWDGPRPYYWLPHTYAGIYEALLAPRRESIKSVFECGIGSPRDPQKPGELADRSTIPQAPSLQVWRDYFPKAEIYAADIDPECMFEAERIHTGVMDQTDPKSVKAFFEAALFEDKKLSSSGFDLMIDDGLHTAAAALSLFTHAKEYLSPTGCYFIEDMETEDLIALRAELYARFSRDYSFSFFNMTMRFAADNNLVLIRPKVKKKRTTTRSAT